MLVYGLTVTAISTQTLFKQSKLYVYSPTIRVHYILSSNHRETERLSGLDTIPNTS